MKAKIRILSLQIKISHKSWNNLDPLFTKTIQTQIVVCTEIQHRRIAIFDLNFHSLSADDNSFILVSTSILKTR